MPGQFIKLPGVSPATDRPRVDLQDSMLPDRGALFLTDLTHPVAPWPDGVPASGSTVPNVAATQASALLGVAASAVAGTIDYQGITGTASSKGLVERTVKGGLHGLITQAGTPTAGDGMRVRYPAAVLDFLAGNVEDDIYVSLWGYITRYGDSNISWGALSLNTAPSTAALLYAFGNDGNTYPTTSTRLGFRRAPAGTWKKAAGLAPQPFISNIAVARETGTVNTGRFGKAFAVGAHGSPNEPFGGSSAAGNQASGVVYRAYMEDLTVSGRSYADVDALDLALFNKEVLTAGGRYYADTYTPPANYA